MGSSDESFAWTNASNNDSNSNDDETMEVANNMKCKSDSHDQELHSRRSCKERMAEHNISIKAKKRKATLFEDNLESPKKKHIKVEPESDVDINKSETKIKQDLSNCKLGETDSSFDDTYLNLCVKEEQASDSNIKKKKQKKSKKKRLSTDIKSSQLEDTKAKLEKANESEEESSYNLVIEDKISIEETAIINPQSDDAKNFHEDAFVKHKKKKKKHKHSLSENNDVSDSIVQCVNNYTSLNETSATEEYKDVHPECNVTQNGDVNELTENINVSKKSRKVSDRIRFEDDTSDMECSQHDDSTMIEVNENTISKQIKRYIRGNLNLKQLKTKITRNHSIVTEMDEVWLVKCPSDIDIAHFTGLKLDVSAKSKIKIDGKNYVSIVDDNVSRLPILSYTFEDQTVIRNFKLNGCINLKKKLPKAHIQDNEIIINDNDFIPLPETKSRHPLFGVNYKKSIKVPSNIAKRLEADPVVVSGDNARKKKKRKKETRLESDTESQEPIQVDTEPVIKKKKAKKRKYSEGEENPCVDTKRLKRDPDCAETWESEKAIEETLFNF